MSTFLDMIPSSEVIVTPFVIMCLSGGGGTRESLLRKPSVELTWISSFCCVAVVRPSSGENVDFL